MPAIEIHANNWSAAILISDQPADLYHVSVKTEGSTKDDALAGAKFIQEIFTYGRTSYIRVNPEANSDRDFDTKITHHRGFARFSFKLEAGEQQSVASNEFIPIGFGNLQCKEAI